MEQNLQNSKSSKTSISKEKRRFIAIDLPDDLKSSLYSETKDYFSREKAVRIIPAENIHLTLKFLGDTKSTKIPEISKAINEAAGNFDSFDFKVSSKLEAFPSSKSARILFAGVGNGSDLIKDFFKNLENSLSKIHIKKEERGFVSHITVARVREKINLSDMISVFELSFSKTVHCKKITLFESILSTAGSRYIIIEEFALK